MIVRLTVRSCIVHRQGSSSIYTMSDRSLIEGETSSFSLCAGLGANLLCVKIGVRLHMTCRELKNVLNEGAFLVRVLPAEEDTTR